MAARLTDRDLTNYSEAATKAEETCKDINNATGSWNRTVLRWNAKQPRLEDQIETQNKAGKTFTRFLNSKVESEKARDQLDAGLKPMKLDKKDEHALINGLEDQRVILDVACQSMETDLSIAKIALNNLLGWGKDTPMKSAVDSWFGWTPYVDELSKSDMPRQHRTRSSSTGSKRETHSNPASAQHRASMGRYSGLEMKK